MYCLINNNLVEEFDSIVDLVKSKVSFDITSKPDNSWLLQYKLKHCYTSEPKFEYSNEYTKTEVINDFCVVHGIRLLNNNGYKVIEGTYLW